MKISNLKRHNETKHKNIEKTYPQNSEVRTTKINALNSSYQAASRILVTSMTQQQKATEASLRVVRILGKHKKPFSDGEIIKECMTEVMDTLFEGKQKEEIKCKIKQVPLSYSTASRRTEALAGDLVKQLCDGIKNAECISLAVDEPTDTTDNAQLMVFVRYYSESRREFVEVEDVLGMVNLCGQRRHL